MKTPNKLANDLRALVSCLDDIAPRLRDLPHAPYGSALYRARTLIAQHGPWLAEALLALATELESDTPPSCTCHPVVGDDGQVYHHADCAARE